MMKCMNGFENCKATDERYGCNDSKLRVIQILVGQCRRCKYDAWGDVMTIKLGVIDTRSDECLTNEPAA